MGPPLVDEDGQGERPSDDVDYDNGERHADGGSSHVLNRPSLANHETSTYRDIIDECADHEHNMAVRSS